MNKTENSLEEIVKGCINKNKSDQKLFFDMFAGKFMAVSQMVSPNNHVANDIMQDAFIKIFKKLPTLNSHDSAAIYSWGKKIIRNQAIDFYRKEKRYSKDFTMGGNIPNKWDEGVSLDNHDEVTYLESKNINPEKIIQAIQNLSPSYKLVFNMFVMDGLSHNEIAEVLEISEGTSKSNLSKAKEKLREELILCN